MADDREESLFSVSRRDVLKRVGLAGAAVAVPGDVLAQVVSTRGPLETLTSQEADTLDAIVARLIPTDANGPGAAEARAARYIDRGLGGALAAFREVYRAGLTAIDAYARSSKGATFAHLSPQNQDAVLSDMEKDAATGFAIGPAAFFNLLLTHTMQGTFCDPFYGGNDRFVGWDLIGYPGVRLIATANDQRMQTPSAATHMSAYDYTMFSKKKPARARATEDTGEFGHGDHRVNGHGDHGEHEVAGHGDHEDHGVTGRGGRGAQET
ncbi:MAG TPA: gluconate 2-dehydrogenase subunit 3 family protein [Vicinamibacterales bacterium]|jgi:gluconate 2-dehydrogenase gamma chain